MIRSLVWPALCGALVLAACDPLPIRCREDSQCRGGMRCDPRRGLCLDEGTYFEHLDGSTAWAGEDGRRDAGADAGADGGTDGGGDAGTDGGTCAANCPAGEFCENSMCSPCEVDSACGPTCISCSGATPRCDAMAGACVGCTASAQCAVATPCCSDSSNTCVTGVGNCL